jgi:hypothetical protein
MRWNSSQNLLCVAAMTFALASSANATTLFRTFISNSGNDSNASGAGCVVTAPCRTLSGAYAATQAGGEIVMMNPSGYGCVTITGSLSILGTDGATSTATSGACITITAATTDKVVIRNLQITGSTVSGTIGIQLNAGQVILRDSGLKMLGTGMVVGNGSSTAHADIINSDIIGNTLGIQTNGAGVPFNSGIGQYLTSACPCMTLVRINGGNYVDNTTVFTENNPTSSGGQPTATIWGIGFYATGYTTLETSTGTGGSAGLPAPQTNTPFPN